MFPGSEILSNRIIRFSPDSYDDVTKKRFQEYYVISDKEWDIYILSEIYRKPNKEIASILKINYGTVCHKSSTAYLKFLYIKEHFNLLVKYDLPYYIYEAKYLLSPSDFEKFQNQLFDYFTSRNFLKLTHDDLSNCFVEPNQLLSSDKFEQFYNIVLNYNSERIQNDIYCNISDSLDDEYAYFYTPEEKQIQENNLKSDQSCELYLSNSYIHNFIDGFMHRTNKNRKKAMF